MNIKWFDWMTDPDAATNDVFVHFPLTTLMKQSSPQMS